METGKYYRKVYGRIYKTSSIAVVPRPTGHVYRHQRV